jgi:hypothetical protein
LDWISLAPYHGAEEPAAKWVGRAKHRRVGGVVCSHSEQQNQVLTKRAARGDPVSTTQARQGSLPDEEGIGAARPAGGEEEEEQQAAEMEPPPLHPRQPTPAAETRRGGEGEELEAACSGRGAGPSRQRDRQGRPTRGGQAYPFLSVVRSFKLGTKAQSNPFSWAGDTHIGWALVWA